MALDVERSGALEISSYERSVKVYRLVGCPFCDHEFEDSEPRWKHFLEEHDPEDAGLNPLGEESDSDSPLFEPIEEIPGKFPVKSTDEDYPLAARDD